MKGSREFGKEESLLLLLSMLIQQYGQPFESCIPECPGEIEKACAFMEGHYMERIYLDQIFLLEDFQPVEILFFRFVMGGLALLAVCPRGLKGTTRRQELTFAAAGLCGVCLYYLLENIALTYTLASNVGVIISAAPFFTAILSHLIMKEEKLRANFFLGFVVAMAGLFLISFNGSKLELNPMGDLPALFLFGFRLKLARFGNPVYLLNIIYLGIGASALCFVTWNFAVKVLGAVKTSVYIYMVPVITAVTSVLILHEKITVLAGLGMALTLAGLFLSESKELTRKEDQHELTK